ncbi:putative oxidoreductase [Chryseolinea serpens]|uniref:Putative oxidoreductase n=1 Tax=Chryseolinea serpens TaxID=947013 RepID=A0A1M5S513_9BACT|nr:DoxX family protein [Chryseolinea serpens]SHH33576.1 putative oxidoreductase [Chryseolinea serpens]
MKTRIVSPDVSLLIARVVVGVVVMAHGAQKLLGWFGGYGFAGTIDYFTRTIGLPYLLALLIIGVESFGMIALVTGLFSRVLSAGVVLIMAGAIAAEHGKFGFFLNWSGSQGGEGFEYHLLVVALASIVALGGAGKFSVDHALSGRSQKNKPKF